MRNPFEAPDMPKKEEDISIDVDVSEFEKKPTQEELETKEKADEVREAVKELGERQTSRYEREKYRHLKAVLKKYDETGELDDVGTI